MKSLKIIPLRDRKRIDNKKSTGYKEADTSLFKIIRKTIFPEMFFVVIALTGCIITESHFLISCTVYNLVNGLGRVIVLYKPPLKKENDRGHILSPQIYIRCITGNILLLIASLYVLGASTRLLLVKANAFDGRLGNFLLVFPVINISFAFLYFVRMKNYTGLFIKSLRFMTFSNICVNAVFFIGITLTIFEERADLIGLSGIVLGGWGAGLTGYMVWNILLTNEKNQELYHHVRNNRTMIFTRLSLKKDIIVVAGKIVLSCITLSGFMLANALYSAGMGIARFFAVSAQKKEKQKQIQSYFHIGTAILGAGLCYVVYSLKTFSAGSAIRFDMNIALIIALYTFSELGLIIKDYIRARKAQDIISEEIKLIGLASTFICLVLTQVAIMSFTTDSDNTLANMLSGIFFGCMSALTGIYMMIRSKYLKNKN